MSGGWGEKVTVVLHHVSESEDFEGSFEAVTLPGVPYDVSIAGSDSRSAESAVNHLLDGLRTFGFTKRVVVEDTTYIGGMRRYEVQVS